MLAGDIEINPGPNKNAVDYVKTPSPGIAEGSVAMTAIYNGRGIRMVC